MPASPEESNGEILGISSVTGNQNLKDGKKPRAHQFGFFENWSCLHF
jgi:hypothetical protein